MGNGKSLPQHAKPEPALSLKLAEITEKNLRRLNATKLDNFISTVGGVSLITANGINDKLVIVGSGYDGSGYTRAFVMYP
jgi:hypothetical protein